MRVIGTSINKVSTVKKNVTVLITGALVTVVTKVKVKLK